MFSTTAAILVKPDAKLIVDEIKLASLPPKHAYVRMLSSGICHTQINDIKSPRRGLPMLLGHEGLGIVEYTEYCTQIKPQDKVVVSWIPWADFENFERFPKPAGWKWKQQNLKPALFTWAEHIAVREEYLVPIKVDEQKLNKNYAVIGCALLTAAGALNMIEKFENGENLAIIGIGGIGSSLIALAKQKGKKIIAIDNKEEALKIGKELGCDETILITESASDNNWNKRTKLVDAVVDTVGNEDSIELAMRISKNGKAGMKTPGATIVVIGLPAKTRQKIDFEYALFNKKRFIFSLGDVYSKEEVHKIMAQIAISPLFLDIIATSYTNLVNINQEIENFKTSKLHGRSIILF